MDDILNDKKKCEEAIEEHGSGYFGTYYDFENIFKSSVVNYSSNRGPGQYPNPPYFNQLSHFKKISKTGNFAPFLEIIPKFRRKKQWDDVEDKRLGTLAERIKEVREFEKKSIEERKRLVPFIVNSQIMKMNGKMEMSLEKRPSGKRLSTTKQKLKRCRNGTRRNKDGNCEPKKSI